MSIRFIPSVSIYWTGPVFCKEGVRETEVSGTNIDTQYQKLYTRTNRVLQSKVPRTLSKHHIPSDHIDGSRMIHSTPIETTKPIYR